MQETSLEDFLRRLHSKVSQTDGTFARAALLTVAASRRIGVHPLPKAIRVAVDAAQPRNPLSSEKDPPVIDVVIPCAAKDQETLAVCIEGIRRSVTNPIGDIILIAPRKDVDRLADFDLGVTLLADEDVVPQEILSLIDERVPSARRGWVRQQVVEFLAVLRGQSPAALVVDADTVLLQPRVWLDGERRQLLCTEWGFHRPYSDHAGRVWGPSVGHVPLSYVTHHQLMQRDIVTKMFGADGSGVARWVELGNYAADASIAEYQSYGAWISTHEPQRVVLAQWLNASCLRDLLTEIRSTAELWRECRRRFPAQYSVSLHAYLNA